MKESVCMREVRKANETGHFSEVDSVSDQLFDRVSGEDHLVSMRAAETFDEHLPQSQEPFSAIDNVSSQIFDRMEAIERPEDRAAAGDGMSGFDERPDGPDGAQNQLGFAEETIAFQKGSDDNAPDDWVLVSRKDARRLAGAEDAGVHAQGRERPNPATAKITFREAQRRSQLPEGADPLVGAPTMVNEESMLASIRQMMVDQKRDFNKKVLPELEPATPAEQGARSGLDGGHLEHVEAFEDVQHGRLKTAMIKFVRKDTVLAICLSIWVSLFLMIFIEPELSQALAAISLVLLGIFQVMRSSTKKRKVIRVVKRKRDTNDLALEDAMLCQKA